MFTAGSSRGTGLRQLGHDRWLRSTTQLRAQAAQFRRFLTDGEVGELCTGSDALAAVLLAERAVQVEKARSRPKTAPSSQALPAPDDEWV